MTTEPQRDFDADMKLAQEATAGPWRYDDGITDDLCDPPERGKPTSIECLMPGRGQVLIGDVVAGDGSPCFVGEAEADRNGRFIAAAREGWPAALREVLRLREAVEDIAWEAYTEHSPAYLALALYHVVGLVGTDGVILGEKAASDARHDEWRDQALAVELELQKLRREAVERDAEVERLKAAIRAHRDQRGDDRCVGDNHTLYEVLPEGDTRPNNETLVTIENCAKFIACQEEAGREYVSPEREIERLREALTWAVGFLRCHHSQTIDGYPDFRNCVELVAERPAMHGVLWHAAARAELAEAENAKLRAMHAAACDRIAGQADALSRTAEGRAVVLLDKLRRLADAGNIEGHTFTYPEPIHLEGEPDRKTVSVWPGTVWFGATEELGEQWLFYAREEGSDGAHTTFAVADMELLED